MKEKLREWAGVAAYGAAALILTLSLVFSTRVADSSALRVEQELRRQFVAHAEGSSDRACAATQLIVFIIKVGNDRAHELKTGSYLTPAQLRRIRQYAKVACAEVPIPPIRT